jgi:branched-subunit amino acid aminotransferase/4-amino-4-deoxychorismate lyase
VGRVWGQLCRSRDNLGVHYDWPRRQPIGRATKGEVRVRRAKEGTFIIYACHVRAGPRAPQAGTTRHGGQGRSARSMIGRFVEPRGV